MFVMRGHHTLMHRNLLSIHGLKKLLSISVLCPYYVKRIKKEKVNKCQKRRMNCLEFHLLTCFCGRFFSI